MGANHPGTYKQLTWDSKSNNDRERELIYIINTLMGSMVIRRASNNRLIGSLEREMDF